MTPVQPLCPQEKYYHQQHLKSIFRKNTDT